MQFLEDIDEIWCRFIIGSNMFKITLVEVKQSNVIVSVKLLNSSYSPKLVSNRYNNVADLLLTKNQNLEDFFQNFKNLCVGEKSKISVQIEECLKKESTCFYILENQTQKEDESFEFIGKDKEIFLSICKSFKVVFENEYGAEDPDDLFAFTEWADLQKLPDPDWGFCINPEIIPKMLEKKNERYMVLVLMYIKDR